MTTDNHLVSTISAEKLVVKDIFCDDYLFTIPNYQRPYSWEEEHCTVLLDDLHTFAFKDADFNELPPYFLGSAVIIKRPFQELIGNNCTQSMIPLDTEELFIKLNDDFISIQYMVGIGPHTVINEFELFYNFLKKISNWKA